MKRIAFCLLCLFLALPLHAQEYDYCTGAGGAAAPSCTTINGDLLKDNFETATTGYDLLTGWTETGTVEAAYSLAGLSAPAESCSQGLQTASTGSVAWTGYDLGAGSGRTTWVKFSIYVRSEGLAFAQNTAIYCPASAATACVGSPGALQIYDAYNGEGADLKIRVSGNTNSATTNTSLSVGAWHTVEACFTDQDIGSDPCSAGTNGYGWVNVDGGTKATFQNQNVAADTRYHQFGIMTASRTIDILFGYVAVDDDGTY